MTRRAGFSLLEVLIALVVVSLALLALTRTAGGQVASFDALRERTLASWVAANVLAETRIATPFPAPGTRDGRVRLGNRDWRWQLEVRATDAGDIAMRLGDASAAQHRVLVIIAQGSGTRPDHAFGATDDADMRRLEVQVFAGDSQMPSSSLVGFGSRQPLP